MKDHLIKKIISILGLLIGCLSYAQSNNENYIQSTSCLDANCLKKAITVQYLNGFGKTKQIVDVKASPAGNDIVTHIEYDNFGRQIKSFLPVPQTGTLNGNIVPNSLDNAVNPNIYGGERIFSEKKIENSPLNRLLEQTKVGIDWVNKPIKYEYMANSDNDVRKYNTLTNITEGITYSIIKVASDSGSQNGFYKESMIYKKKATDEDGNVIYEYTNDQNQLVLIRSVLSANEYADTYYVYNEYNNLAFVIPPKASDIIKDLPPGIQISDDILDNLCYQYRFDGKNRVAEKKLPNKGWEYYVYDKQDRLVLTQDAVLRTTNNNFKKRGWIFVKYDIYGRVVYTGFFNNTASRLSMQTALNNMTLNAGNNEERVRIPFNLNGMDIYYTKNAFPTSSMTVLSVNYYDSYPPQSPSTPTKILDQYTLQHSSTAYDDPTAVSLPTASFLKNIENDDWTKIFNYYDTKGRIIGTHSANHLGGYTKTESKLDFAGLPQTVITKHKRLEIDTERVITETFDYDHQNRLLVHKHQVDSNPVEILTQNKYNELSQLESKKVGGTSLGSSLQQIDYKYNIRGWMTMINDPSNLGNDLFGYKINYNKVEGQEVPNNDYSDQKVKPKYNGNIAEVSWKTLTESNEPLKTYGYVYDSLNRLTAGFYQKSGNEFAKEYFEKLEYDLNGNIIRLQRSAGILTGSNTALVIDDLKYDYIGNKLIRVTDQQMNSSGYPYTANPATIVYDNENVSGNGNMTSHPDKGISSIQYNYLNLPTRIIQNSKITDYTYRADGVKIKKLFGNIETDYLDGFQYKSTKPSEESSSGGGIIVEPDPSEIAIIKLRIIPTSEGYYDVLNNAYIYNYTDHLGNVRLSYTDTNKDGVIQPRQYFQSQCYDIPSDPWGIPSCIDIWKPGEIVEINNYYPFGLLHDYTATSQNAYQYKYNGKELQETGMYDYGARTYMPDLGRWGVADSKAELMRRWSTYNYAFDNPIRFIDPDGRAPKDDHFNKYGRYIGTDNKKTNNVIVHTNSSAKKLSQLNGDKGVKLSQLDYNSRGTAKAVSNVIAHYAGEKGLTGIYGVKSIKDSHTLAHTTPQKSVYFNSKALSSGYLNDAYDIRSVLDHEAGKAGHKNENIVPYTYLAHAKVYLGQSKTSDYGKSTLNNQNSVAAGFVQRLWNAYKQDEISWEGMNPYLNDFNKNNTGGVQVFPIGGYEGEPMQLIIQNGSFKSEPTTLEKMTSPHD